MSSIADTIEEKRAFINVSLCYKCWGSNPQLWSPLTEQLKNFVFCILVNDAWTISYVISEISIFSHHLCVISQDQNIWLRKVRFITRTEMSLLLLLAQAGATPRADEFSVCLLHRSRFCASSIAFHAYP